MSQILKKAHEQFSESNRTMSSWSDVIDEEPAACVEDCPDDLGGILELLDATSDGSGSLRYTDDFGMADDPEDTTSGSSGAQLFAVSPAC